MPYGDGQYPIHFVVEDDGTIHVGSEYGRSGRAIYDTLQEARRAAKAARAKACWRWFWRLWGL